MMKKVRVAINGLGRIGRAFLKQANDRPELELVAINDLADLENLAYLLKYDSAYGRWPIGVRTSPGKLIVGCKVISFSQEKDPTQLPWRANAVDVVVEATGVFETYAKAKAHLTAGARKVVISAPTKDEPPIGVPAGTVLLGVNEDKFGSCQITSNASCTTNAASPLIAVLQEKLGIEKAVLNTVHGYTASQKLVDGPDGKDFRRGRAAAVNIVPSTTGAAIAVTKALPELAGKFDGLAVRVPVITGSLVDITFISKKKTSVAEVNQILKGASVSERWKNILAVTEEPLVSADIIGSRYASIAQLDLTQVVDGNLVKVLAWYDNEAGYTHTLVQHVIKLGQAA